MTGIAKEKEWQRCKKRSEKRKKKKEEVDGDCGKKGMAMVLRKGRKGRRRKVTEITKKRIAKSMGR